MCDFKSLLQQKDGFAEDTLRAPPYSILCKGLTVRTKTIFHKNLKEYSVKLYDEVDTARDINGL